MLDRFGLLPPELRADLEREQMVDSQISQAAHVAKGLRDLDPRLELCFFTERAEPLLGIKPGRWHVRRRNETTADTYYPIVDPEDGSYREPDWGVVEAMKAADSWSPDYELPDDDIEAEDARLAEKRAKQNEAVKDELASNFAAAKRVSGEGGLHKRLWGKGGLKGVAGS